MLVTVPSLGERRRLAAGALAPLADSLAADLARLAHATELYIPDVKARLTRAGGRCPRCGGGLDFDPWSPQQHRCASCATEAIGADHDGMWVMWYQLWLAERAVHAAVLFALRGEPAHRALAERILRAYAECYLTYPNRDNVLGPTRVFFSTYLESIWTLQLACALDVLESAGAGTLGGTVRERIIQPSAALIAQYDEGLSNRQVWNNAALLASAGLLGDTAMAQRAVAGRSGLIVHLERALLPDGTWYEGENYHLFAHRGLWYATTLADSAGLAIPIELRDRYRRAFETPFLTALPDFTFPSRRDSQYRVSLRQWRIAESCELGLAVASSPVLSAALRELYRTDVARGDTCRDRSTAEAERNVPASRLTRADLGWKSLLFAKEAAVESESASNPLGSVLLPNQGFAVLRRDDARAYVALDYGESGGGHGHPDRLNLWLVVGDARILEDVGTGSYVDPSLHWYRSTLAHNAPLADGQSQVRADGELLAYSERADFGWTLARAALLPNVDAERAVIAAKGYLVDELLWIGPSSTMIDLPYHISANVPEVSSWHDASMIGGRGLEDGFSYVLSSSHSEPMSAAVIVGDVNGVAVKMWIVGDAPFVLWRVLAPGPPNEPPRDFFVVRSVGGMGRIRSVIDWSASVADVQAAEESLTVSLSNGSRHVHSRREDEWTIAIGSDRIALASVPLDAKPYTYAHLTPEPPREVHLRRSAAVPTEPGALTLDHESSVRYRLAGEHYRRSEQSWGEAGCPAATVAFAATANEFHVDLVVEKSPLAFAPARSENRLDNEHPDTNSDGVQLYIGDWAWLLVPESQPPNVRVTPRHTTPQAAPQVRATWDLSPGGYAVRIVVPMTGAEDARFVGDVIVNEMPSLSERERRRGQLVLSGARGEWIYLRGDRQDPSRFLHFVIMDA